VTCSLAPEWAVVMVSLVEKKVGLMDFVSAQPREYQQSTSDVGLNRNKQ
jgi:hypothetical protein